MTTSHSRRDVLRIITVAASASALGLTGCHGSSNSPEVTPPAPAPATGQTLAGDAYFPQGVASGDPRTHSVILWARVAEPGARATDASLRLQVARDSAFADRVVDSAFSALGAHDGCIKIRVTQLDAGRSYFYRFVYVRSDGNFYLSPTGRTRTAGEVTDTRAVKFAFVSCQDYIGRFYNTLLPLLDQDLDFVVHLGDSIYETTGDPSFQGGNASRSIRFDDQAGAIALGTAPNTFFAAKSLDNYRQLHRTYRSDAVLRQIYQRFPVISIWDDHEFSNDCWKSTGTYSDGRSDERDDARRRNGDRAWLEYTPIDTEAGSTTASLDTTDAQTYPNARIFRSFRFGRDIELFLTDYRSFRPDHLIPEDAFPGTVVMDRAALTRVLALAGVPYDAVKANFSPYLNIDAPAFLGYKQVALAVLTLGYQAEGFEIAQAAIRAQQVVTGNFATTILNSLVAQYNAQVPAAQQVPPVSDALIATLDTGIAYFTLGKTTLFGNLGARYFVVKDTFDLYATHRLLTQGTSAQLAYGDVQDAWLRPAIAASTARWKLVASSVSFTSMVLDLTPPALGVPAPFNQRFYLNVDQWDGFPNQKSTYLTQVFGQVPGVVILSGDIHASFATRHNANVAEFTTPAISSSSFRALLASAAAGSAQLAPLAGPLLPALDQLLRAANGSIRYVQSNRHGVAVASIDASAMQVTFTELPEARATTSAYDTPTSINADLRTTVLRYDGSEVLSASGTALLAIVESADPVGAET